MKLECPGISKLVVIKERPSFPKDHVSPLHFSSLSCIDLSFKLGLG